ncbi:hypothetical protein BDK51DRAFT_50327 [Blyttiomyces helicus]|uniref:Uncharacterized protein n=1 Tax=Blyttiomyces helicus TaxID=388810 RepID=A0A4P9WAP0_9FUNG|nr:hypothetical protein BDK51DRAFT_50327 [Blyttiomyces helicus]|eukprot:RKO89669.1 hypothetical protein BDK51DRAFT_50327 [Blyttiomyces helicus]
MQTATRPRPNHAAASVAHFFPPSSPSPAFGARAVHTPRPTSHIAAPSPHALYEPVPQKALHMLVPRLDVSTPEPTKTPWATSTTAARLPLQPLGLTASPTSEDAAAPTPEWAEDEDAQAELFEILRGPQAQLRWESPPPVAASPDGPGMLFASAATSDVPAYGDPPSAFFALAGTPPSPAALTPRFEPPALCKTPSPATAARRLPVPQPFRMHHSAQAPMVPERTASPAPLLGPTVSTVGLLCPSPDLIAARRIGRAGSHARSRSMLRFIVDPACSGAPAQEKAKIV